MAQFSEKHDVLDDSYARVEQRVMEHVVDHWFIQGGAAQFGELGSPQNADELVSAILARVRKREGSLAQTPPVRDDQ